MRFKLNFSRARFSFVLACSYSAEAACLLRNSARLALAHWRKEILSNVGVT